MRIDLKKDQQRVSKYIERRAKEYPKYVNAGPGRDEDPIRLVTLGFQIDQAGWIALVFDTRPKAESDGEWQGFIEENAEPFQGWFKAFDDMIKNDSVLSVTQHDGERRSFMADTEMEVIAECFGSMCRDVLEQARKKGVFKKLPLADNCRLAVEEHEGWFGWFEEAAGTKKKPDEREVMEGLRRAAAKRSKPGQIAYWIDQLDHLAAGKSCDANNLLYCEDFVLDQLSKIGKDAVVPLLEWANTWAAKPEFKPKEQLGKGEDVEYPKTNVLCRTFMSLEKWIKSLPEAEPLIRQYIATAIKVKPVREVKVVRKKTTERNIYGITPFHAARLLYSRYKGYPEPVIDESGNQLHQPERFTSGTEQ